MGNVLDAKLLCKVHDKKKRNELNLRLKKMYWRLGKYSRWTYGIQLCGCISKSNILTVQLYENKVLRNIGNGPRYIRNREFHHDLQMNSVDETIAKLARSHEQFHHHDKIEALLLLNNINLTRRLMRVKHFELIK